MALTVMVVPHSHIDTEWFWSYETTIDWATEILRQALNRTVDDPKYCFSQDQVTIMAPVWDQLDDASRTAWQSVVDQGRWEPLLGFFTSPGLAEPTGESLVRQVLTGQEWTEAHFGRPARIAWLIDQFGQIPQLPQILSQAGYVGYVFSRDLPPDRDIANFSADFWYQGPDGSQILTHWLAGHYSIGPGNLAERLKVLDQHSRHDVWLVPWGSDVVRPEMSATEILGMVTEAVHHLVPEAEVCLGTPSQYFERMASHGVALPVIDWDFNPPGRVRGDLRGTYDNRYRFKVLHRSVEEGLVATETLAAVLGVHLAGTFRRHWELLLLSEFHDTMGGSCSDTVFERAMERLQGVRENLRQFQTQWLSQTVRHDEIAVFNPWVQAQSDLISVLPGDATSWWSVQDRQGRVLPSRQVAPGSPVECLVTVPALSVGAVTLVRGGSSAGTRQWLNHDSPNVTLETAYYQVEIRPCDGFLGEFRTHSGQMISARDDGMHRLEWWSETKPDLEGAIHLNGTHEALVEDLDECWIEQSALGQIVGFGRPAMGGRLCHTFRFYHHTRRIDCDVYLEGVVPDDGMLVVRFPYREGPESGIWYETPFALTRRPKGHYAAQSFAASGDRKGIAVFNQGTPGYWFDTEAWFLVLLRSVTRYNAYSENATKSLGMGIFPGMQRHPVDEYSLGKTGTVLAHEVGNHHLQYAMVPYESGLAESQVAEQAHAWNRPFVTGVGRIGKDTAAEVGPPISLAGIPVILDALKPAEDGKGWILRFHEPYGEKGTLTLRLTSRWSTACRVDLRERSLDESGSGPTITTTVSPFQIQSWRLIEKEQSE